jgi:hypothetical protein
MSGPPDSLRGGTETARVPTPATQAEREHRAQQRADAADVRAARRQSPLTGRRRTGRPS